MGVIRKQGLWSTLFIYSGFLFGFLNTIVLFPRFLSAEEYGLTMVLIDAGKFFSGLALLGTLSIMVKFSPFYKGNLQNKENDLLSLTLFIALAGFTVGTLIILANTDTVIRKFGTHSPLFAEYFYLVIPLAFLMMIYSLLETFAAIFHYTRAGAFLREVVVRVVVSILLLLVGWNALDTVWFFRAYAFQYLPVLLIMLFFLKRKNILLLPKFSRVTKKFKRRILNYALFMQGGIALNVAATTIDSIFIASMGGLPKVATFTIGRYLSELVQAPYRAFAAISGPIISEAWKSRNLGLLDEIYKKTSINQLLAGMLVFGGLWINMDWILAWVGVHFAEAKTIFLVLGITRLIDLGAGLNGEILGTSRRWRFSFISQSVLMFLFIPVNFLLLKYYGILGSALANLLAYFLYNFVRFVYLWKHFRLQPFTSRTFYPLLAGGGMILLYEFGIDGPGETMTTELICSAVFGIVFIAGALILAVSEDMNRLVNELRRKYLG